MILQIWGCMYGWGGGMNWQVQRCTGWGNALQMGRGVMGVVQQKQQG